MPPHTNFSSRLDPICQGELGILQYHRHNQTHREANESPQRHVFLLSPRLAHGFAAAPSRRGARHRLECDKSAEGIDTDAGDLVIAAKRDGGRDPACARYSSATDSLTYSPRTTTTRRARGGRCASTRSVSRAGRACVASCAQATRHALSRDFELHPDAERLSNAETASRVRLPLPDATRHPPRPLRVNATPSPLLLHVPRRPRASAEWRAESGWIFRGRGAPPDTVDGALRTRLEGWGRIGRGGSHLLVQLAALTAHAQSHSDTGHKTHAL
ncbi:hypothetical protein DFH09DRAFT_1137009 [Mycena vulgaris]|nr:hypothetical protein DFH09DRAFT_1137009 [Mycena vulgaris]